MRESLDAAISSSTILVDNASQLATFTVLQLAVYAGMQVPVGAAPEGIVADAQTRTVAVAKRNPNELVLINADTGVVTGRTPLPGVVRHLQLARPGGPVLVPVESANALVRVDLPGGRAEPQVITGTVPHDASEAPDGTVFVANEHGGTVAAVRGDQVVKVFTDSVQDASHGAGQTRPVNSGKLFVEWRTSSASFQSPWKYR